MSRSIHPESTGTGSIEPHRAPVSPRARLHPFEASLPLEWQIETLLAKNVRGPVNLVGPPGSGKTVALQHLSSSLDPDAPVLLMEKLEIGAEALFQTRLALFTSVPPSDPQRFVTLEMSPWTDEDLIEYMLATHPGRCRAVMDRLKSDPLRASLHGLPELWRIVLDEMAADDEVANIEPALSCFLARHLSDPQVREAAERLCLFALAPMWPIAGCAVSPRLERIIRHQPVKMMLAARRLMLLLRDQMAGDELKVKLPDELINHCGRRVAMCPAAIETLESITRAPADRLHAMAVSILHAAGIGWRPTRHVSLNLIDARIEGAGWSGVELPRSAMKRANFRHAMLDHVNFEAADLSNATLKSASLRHARLTRARLSNADLRAADLTAAMAFDANFVGADLTGARLDCASLHKAAFRRAILAGSSLRGADLRNTDLHTAELDEADFSNSDLSEANLRELPLRLAKLSGVVFRQADMIRCNLEEIETTADFSLALLTSGLFTGSVLHGCSFRGADLRHCGLADIDWEGADLRDADLRGSTFHMGSTRSGLVGSDIPCEGSRTGFYTDDYGDREFKDPREVRKANLCDVDLRGANIEGVDFYLVDLRGARYTNSQAEWFNRCGAILCPP